MCILPFFSIFDFCRKIPQLCWVVVSKAMDLQGLIGCQWKDIFHIFHLAPIFLKLWHWRSHSDFSKKWLQLSALKIFISALSTLMHGYWNGPKRVRTRCSTTSCRKQFAIILEGSGNFTSSTRLRVLDCMQLRKQANKLQCANLLAKEIDILFRYNN